MDAPEAVAAYAPRDISARRWTTIRPNVLAWVSHSPECSAAAAVARTRVVARYIDWCLDQGFPLDAETILVEDLIESWFASGAVTTRAKGTYRSHLRTVARANTKRAVWTPTPEPMRRASLRDPYSDEEVEGYREVVRRQATPRRSRVLDVIIHVGLGFGLTPAEMHALAVSDVTHRDGLVLATVSGRTVPARSMYAADIVRVVAATDGERVLGDHLGDHRRFERLVNTVEIPPYLPALRARRLRTTWLVDVLSDATLTLPEFQRISGLRSGRVLDDLVPFLPVDEDTYLHRAVGR